MATYLQQSAVWLPGILWALRAAFGERNLERGTWRSLWLFALAGGLWALQLLRGYPQTWYLSGLCAAAYALVELALALRARRRASPGATVGPRPWSAGRSSSPFSG